MIFLIILQISNFLELFNVPKSEQTIVMATHDYDIIEQFPGRIIQFQNKSIEE